MGLRPPFETFTGPTCKGCYALGTACGTCEKCKWERDVQNACPHAHPVASKYAMGVEYHCADCGLLIQPTGATEDGATMIAAERRRQVKTEGWTAEHDDDWEDGQLGRAAEAYRLAASGMLAGSTAKTWKVPPHIWPWAHCWWKPSDDPIRNLVKAGALIAAEIDRLRRATRCPISFVCRTCQDFGFVKTNGEVVPCPHCNEDGGDEVTG